MGIFNSGGFTNESGGAYAINYDHKEEAVRAGRRKLEEQKAVFSDSGAERVQFENDIEEAKTKDDFQRYGRAQAERSYQRQSMLEKLQEDRKGASDTQSKLWGGISDTINKKIDDVLSRALSGI